jgi:hypothetical protein
MERGIKTQPSKRLKIFFWIILGSLSTFFAEVVSGADMFPFFHVWGLIVIVPLYTLHILVLAHAVFSYGKPRLYTLFIAGAIFGMYEAYITKVLWNPFWGEPLISLAGIAVVEMIVLVLFWHAFMSFIVPLFVSENVLTGSRRITNGLPDRIRKLLDSRKKRYSLLVFLAIAFGMFQSTNSPSPGDSLLSGLSTSAVLIGLIFLWKIGTRGKKYDIKALLPNKKEFLVLFALLIIMYVVSGIYLVPESLPGLGPQLIIWLVYAGLFILLFFQLKKSRGMEFPEAMDTKSDFSFKMLIIFCLLFTVSSAAGKPIMGPYEGLIFILTFWFLFSIIGIIMLFQSIIDLFRTANS